MVTTHNIEDGENRLDMNKCNEKHKNQKEEEIQIVDLATTSFDLNVKVQRSMERYIPLMMSKMKTWIM